MNNEPRNSNANDTNTFDEELETLTNESEEAAEFGDPPTGGAGGGRASLTDPPTGGAGGGKRFDIEGVEA